MRHLSFDLAQNLEVAAQPLRDLNQERFRFSLVMLAIAAPVFAQGGRAEINGTVYDQDKAVTPGVNISVTSEDTGLVRTTVTTGEGRFVVATLLPGTYTVSGELQGFQTASQSGLRLSVGQELSLNLTMQLAGIAENLASAHTEALRLARRHGLVSISIPAVATGIHRYPAPLAAELAVGTVVADLRAHGAPATVRFVLATSSMLEIYAGAARGHFTEAPARSGRGITFSGFRTT